MDKTLALNSNVVAVKDQVSCDVGNEMVLLHLKKGIYFGFNSIGARIWSLIQQPRRIAEIRNILVHEYDVETEQCTQDLLQLLTRLRSHDLLEILPNEKHQ